MLNIYHLVQEQTRQSPDQIALIDYRKGHGRTCSFAELDKSSAGIVALLHQQGLRPGDKVLILQPMSIELYQIIAAIFRSGLVALFIDPSLGKKNIQRFCRQQQPRGVVLSPAAQILRLLIPSLKRIPVKIAIGIGFPGDLRLNTYRQLSPRLVTLDLPPDSPALISLTSGSTGHPKGIVRSHDFLLDQHRILAQTLDQRPGQICLVVLPLFVLSNLASGIGSLLAPAQAARGKRSQLKHLVEGVIKHRPTNAIGGPGFFQSIADYCKTHDIQLPGLNRIFVGGAPVVPKLIKDLRIMAPRSAVTNVYGATEAEPIATLSYAESNADDIQATRKGRGLPVGRPVDSIEVWVLPDHWGEPIGPLSRQTFHQLRLPPGRIGEIVVSGPHVHTGYLEKRLNLRSKIEVEGTIWHCTGDTGYFDDRGRLWLAGRCAARITRGEKCIHPLMIESAARCFEGVHQAALIQHRERLLLLLQADRGTTINIDQLSSQLSWAGIDEFRVVKWIPVDQRHHAKIDLKSLKKMVRLVKS